MGLRTPDLFWSCTSIVLIITSQEWEPGFYSSGSLFVAKKHLARKSRDAFIFMKIFTLTRCNLLKFFFFVILNAFHQRIQISGYVGKVKKKVEYLSIFNVELKHLWNRKHLLKRYWKSGRRGCSIVNLVLNFVWIVYISNTNSGTANEC